MKTVNIKLVEKVLGPIGGYCDRDEEFAKYDTYDWMDESDVKAIIRAEILPFFLQQNDHYKSEFKTSLSYYLTTNSYDLDGMLASLLIPSDTGGEPSFFFVWMWECFFGDESYEMPDFSDYQEKEDYYAAGIVMRPDLTDYYNDRREQDALAQQNYNNRKSTWVQFGEWWLEIKHSYKK